MVLLYDECCSTISFFSTEHEMTGFHKFPAFVTAAHNGALNEMRLDSDNFSSSYEESLLGGESKN